MFIDELAVWVVGVSFMLFPLQSFVQKPELSFHWYNTRNSEVFTQHIAILATCKVASWIVCGLLTPEIIILWIRITTSMKNNNSGLTVPSCIELKNKLQKTYSNVIRDVVFMCFYNFVRYKNLPILSLYPIIYTCPIEKIDFIGLSSKIVPISSRFSDVIIDNFCKQQNRRKLN